MILTGNKIQEEVKSGKIIIQPFMQEKMTTNSYDLTLGNKLLAYTDAVLDPKVKPMTQEIIIPDNGYNNCYVNN